MGARTGERKTQILHTLAQMLEHPAAERITTADGSVRDARVLRGPGRLRDLRPGVHARRQDAFRRDPAPGRRLDLRQALDALAGFQGRHATAPVGRGGHQGRRRRDRRIVRNIALLHHPHPTPLPLWGMVGVGGNAAVVSHKHKNARRVTQQSRAPEASRNRNRTVIAGA